MSARRLLMLVLFAVLGVLAAGLLVGGFLLVRRVGLSALAAALLVGWLSPLLVSGPVVLGVVALDRRSPAARPRVSPAAPGDPGGEKEQV